MSSFMMRAIIFVLPFLLCAYGSNETPRVKSGAEEISNKEGDVLANKGFENKTIPTDTPNAESRIRRTENAEVTEKNLASKLAKASATTPGTPAKPEGVEKREAANAVKNKSKDSGEVPSSKGLVKQENASEAINANKTVIDVVIEANRSVGVEANVANMEPRNSLPKPIETSINARSSFTELTSSNFNQTVINGKTAWFVEFFSTDCENCNLIRKPLEDMENKTSQVRVGIVNIGKEAELKKRFDINEVPSFGVFFPGHDEPQFYNISLSDADMRIIAAKADARTTVVQKVTPRAAQATSSKIPFVGTTTIVSGLILNESGLRFGKMDVENVTVAPELEAQYSGGIVVDSSGLMGSLIFFMLLTASKLNYYV